MILSASGTWGYGWWWAGGAIMFVCLAMMMLMMSRSPRGSHWFPFCGMGWHHDHENEGRRPEDTLADRFARGEIDTDEYQRRLAALRETSEVGKSV